MPKVVKSKSKRAPKPSKPRVPRVPRAQYPIVRALTESFFDVISTLLRDGVVVVPVLSPKEVAEYRINLNDATKHFPEFKPEYVKDGALDTPGVVFVGGSFGALGVPASVHCHVVRTLRERLHGMLMPILKTVVVHDAFKKIFPDTGAPEDLYVEHVIDRLCFRPRRVGGGGASESWHIDGSPQADSTDVITGGWINLDTTDEVQYFLCQRGSHSTAWKAGHPTRAHVGFTPIKDPVHRAQLDETGEFIAIPSGAAVLFFQNICHSVVPAPIKSKLKSNTPSARLYFGGRISTSGTPLMGTDRLIDTLKTLGPLRIKSNQESENYPNLYTVTPSGLRILKKWTADAFRTDLPGLLETVTIKTTGEVYTRPLSLSASYVALGIADTPDVAALCPPYTQDEINMHMPHVALE